MASESSESWTRQNRVKKMTALIAVVGALVLVGAATSRGGYKMHFKAGADKVRIAEFEAQSIDGRVVQDTGPSFGFIAKTSTYNAALKSDIDAYGCQNMFIFKHMIHHWTAYKVISCDTANDPLVITARTVWPYWPGMKEDLWTIKVPSNDVMVCEEYSANLNNNGQLIAHRTVPHCYFGSYQWPSPIPKYHFNPITIKVSRVAGATSSTAMHPPNQLWSTLHNLGPGQGGVCPQVGIKKSGGAGYIVFEVGGCWYSNTDNIRVFGYYTKPDGTRLSLQVEMINGGGHSGSMTVYGCHLSNNPPNGASGSNPVHITASSGSSFAYSPLTNSKCDNNHIRLVY